MNIPAYFEQGGFVPGNPCCPLYVDQLPGVGGTLSGRPEDFIVDEIPAYEPKGDGHHWYVQIRKRGMSTKAAQRLLADAAGVDPRDIGFAGRKDALAITTQWFSLPAQPVDPKHDDLEILQENRHANKLRIGHLRGNRFKICLRDVHPEAAARLPALTDVIARGVPNYFGPQRFGADGRGLAQSWAWLTNGRYRRKNRWIDRRFSASVVQAALYNRWLGARVHDHLFERALCGDVYKKRETGGLFIGTATSEEQQRLDGGEIDATGPLFGPKMKAATEDAGRREEAIRTECGLEDKHWQVLGRSAAGGRRVARIVPQAFTWSANDSDATVTMQFVLPPGAFATNILAEIIQDRRPTSGGGSST
ncbi:MAG: tRNA pseudouridine(13) synthase TruD [Myxococcota bacterium]|nr:tRNA pseudouridine(13) synthase TruD [Myxococcota bacterium]